MEWISIEDQLPPKNVYVLISRYDGRKNVKMHFIQIACRFGEQWFSDHDGDELDPKYGIITHWMPLPEPVKAL